MKKPTLKSLLRSLAIIVVALAVVLVIIKVKAGTSLDPTGPPTDEGTRMNSLGHLYCKLTNTDCPGTAPSLDPLGAPGSDESKMHTIKEIYNVAPGVSEMTTESGEVLCGEKFFGTGGTETGTACSLCMKDCVDGSCTPIADGEEDNSNDAGLGAVCEQACKKCDGAGNCVNIAKFEEDNIGSHTCLYANGYSCDGSGNCVDYKYVFVTSISWTGNLKGGEATGLAGADAKCQARADAGTATSGIGGTWHAWLSDSTADAKDRVPHSSAGYYLVDNTEIASNWDRLIDAATFNLFHSINMDENGNTITSDPDKVWTNTKSSGANNTVYSACNKWTVGVDDGSNAASFGGIEKINGQWNGWSWARCNNVFRLYCFHN